MSKVIAIIDIPDAWFEEKEKWFLCIEDASLRYEEDGALMNYKDFYKDFELKPLPQKKTELKGREKERCGYSFLKQVGYIKGFNDCLDEILEGAKDETATNSDHTSL